MWDVQGVLKPCAFCWTASPQLFAKFRQNSSLSLRIAWLLPWLMNLMRPGLSLQLPGLTSLPAPCSLSRQWRSMLHCARGFYTNCSWQNYWAREQIWIVSCDRLGQTSLEYSQPRKTRQAKLEMKSNGKQNTRVWFSATSKYLDFCLIKIIKIFMMKKFL